MQEPYSRFDVFHHFVFVVRKRRRMLLAVGLSTFLLVLFFTYLITPTWRGTTKILVERTSKQNLGVFRDLEIPVGEAPTAENYNLLEVLTGENMAYAIVSDFSLDDRLQSSRQHPSEPRGWIKKGIVETILAPVRLMELVGILPRGEKNWLDEASDEFLDDWQDIEPEEGTSVIEIAIDGESPQLARDIPNRMVQLLEAKTKDFVSEGADVADDAIEGQLVRAEQSLATAEADLATYKRQNDIVDLPEENRLSLARVENIWTEMAGLDQQRGELVARLRETQNADAAKPDLAMQSAAAAGDPVVVDLEEALSKLEAEKSAILKEKKSAHPDVVKLQAAIDANKEKLRSAEEKAFRSGLFLRAVNLKMDIYALDSKRHALQQTLSELRDGLDAIPQKEVELARLQRIADVNRSMFEALGARKAKLAIQKEAHTSEYAIRVLDAAFVPDGAQPDSPSWPLNVVVGMFLAVVLAFGSIFMAEYWNDALVHSRDVEQTLSLPVLGSVPDLEVLATTGSRNGGNGHHGRRRRVSV